MSTQITINDVIPRTQLVASSLQQIFNCNWTANAATDILVYARATGVAANDVTQVISSADYNVTFIGGTETVRVTFTVGRTLDDVVTIVRNTPADRLNIYTNTNFTPSMINQDVGILTLVDQQSQMFDEEISLRYNKSEILVAVTDTMLPKLVANQIWAKNSANTALIAYDVPANGGLAPKTAKYLIQTSTSELPNAQAMGALSSGIVVNTITSGVQLTRTLTGTANQIDIVDGNGISGNPTISITDNAKIGGTGGLGIPTGTTGQRPGTPSGTELRLNTSLGSLEYWGGAAWSPINDGDDVDSLTGTANEVLVNGTSGVVTNGVITLTVGASLAALSVLASTGFIAQTGANAFADRTLTGTANQIDITNTAGVAGDPVFSLSATVNLPGTFDINSSTAVSAIINDDTLATATSSNIATALSLKSYIDGRVVGLNIQGSCVAASTAALTVTYANGAAGVGATLTNAGALAALTLDGVTPTINQRILIKNQASDFENGIYTITTLGTGAIAWILTRATDFDTAAEIQAGDWVVITAGTVQANSSWLETATVVTVGTDAVTFIQFTVSLPITVANGGTGLTSLAINQMLYASATNVMSAISAANSSVLVTSAGGVPSLSTTLPEGIDAAGMRLTQPRIITGLYDTNDLLLLGITATATAVNSFQAANAATGGSPALSAVGTDTNISLQFAGKGTGGVIIGGTSTNDSAAAGSVGQLISSNIAVASSVAISSNTATNLTSISLTAGDWIVGGNIRIVNTGQNLTRHIVWTSITSATVPDVSNVSEFDGNTTTYLTDGGLAPVTRLSLSGTTTVYVSAFTTFGAGTTSMCGNIWARRLR